MCPGEERTPIMGQNVRTRSFCILVCLGLEPAVTALLQRATGCTLPDQTWAARCTTGHRQRHRGQSQDAAPLHGIHRHHGRPGDRGDSCPGGRLHRAEALPRRTSHQSRGALVSARPAHLQRRGAEGQSRRGQGRSGPAVRQRGGGGVPRRVAAGTESRRADQDRTGRGTLYAPGQGTGRLATRPGRVYCPTRRRHGKKWRPARRS